MRAGPALRLALVGVVPLLVAASDPAGDARGCTGGAGTGVPDLVGADGYIVELGTSARWELTFAEPLTVPDAQGRPFRVDIVIRDPKVPAQSFAYYRNVNRLVRVDATVEHPTEIYLLPERGTSEFNPPIVEGPSMTIQVPGRTLTEDEDLTGTSPGLGSLRWTVIVRDGRSCDFLGDGRPTHELLVSPTPTPTPEAGAPASDPSSGFSGWTGAAGALVAGVLLTALVYRSRRTR